MILRVLACLALPLSLPATAQPLRRELGQPGYRAFFDDLQLAVRTNDRARVTSLISYPLRVTTPNASGDRRSRFYRTPAAVRAAYSRIFTPRVRRAILRQRYERLFVNSRGVMFGNGEICLPKSAWTGAAPRPAPRRLSPSIPSFPDRG